METTYVKSDGEPIPPPIICGSKHPLLELACEWSIQHREAGSKCAAFVVRERLRGGRKPYVHRIEWQLPEVIKAASGMPIGELTVEWLGMRNGAPTAAK